MRDRRVPGENDHETEETLQPKDGSPDMLSLHVSSGGSRYEVDTVKGGAKRDIKGSGQASLQKSGAGGVFTIDARAMSGEAIAGKIACSRFGAAHRLPGRHAPADPRSATYASALIASA